MIEEIWRTRDGSISDKLLNATIVVLFFGLHLAGMVLMAISLLVLVVLFPYFFLALAATEQRLILSSVLQSLNFLLASFTTFLASFRTIPDRGVLFFCPDMISPIAIMFPLNMFRSTVL